MELEQASVNIVRSAARGRIKDGSGGPPVLRVVIAGQHVELLNSLHWRDVNAQAGERLRVRHTIQRLVVGAVRKSVGFPNPVSLRIDQARRRRLWRCDARQKLDKFLVVPVEYRSFGQHANVHGA